MLNLEELENVAGGEILSIKTYIEYDQEVLVMEDKLEMAALSEDQLADVTGGIYIKVKPFCKYNGNMECKWKEKCDSCEYKPSIASIEKKISG